ncbi:MAG: FAD-binding and (Fe-S)-binding domain-containing protein [Desulfitobacteriaceae bacterium]|nr:FAD-binding and (Fe-S)-binding domain-containing protein [Desulfitobacteriaceae bacterium]MDI6913522.1 FAD-binding and (Fe-S)-binding domain-containing protein [Desulfitobacteriaceae bacterium]
MKNNLTTTQMSRLKGIFSERVRFNKVERICYSHDMGIMPDQIRNLIECIPDGVAQPTSVEEVIALVKVAKEERIPLVPRGAGSAGFGGSVPAKAGIIVDFVRMNKILDVDTKSMTATVEPGVIWTNLEQELNQRGLALRAFPSSSNSSTVGGWVAQGGSGYGSYEFGDCSQNVVAVDVVLPNGKLKTYTGDALQNVYSLCGITGFIVKVTISTRELDEENVMLSAFPDLEKAAGFLKGLSGEKVGVWNVSLATPAFTALKQKALEHYVLPEDEYLVTMVFPKPRRSAVENQIRRLTMSNGGKVMREKLAVEEWDDKFYPMRFKKLGPTLVASEVVVPIKGVEEFVGQVERKFKGDFALEGTMVGPDHISILGFMLTDERKLGFPLAYACALDVIDGGEKVGGHVFSVGMYFTDRAKSFYGEEHLQRIWNFKQEIDPKGIMNPGKIVPPSLDKQSPTKMLSAAMKVANAGSGVIGLAGRLLTKWQKGDFASPLDEELTDDTFACAMCGYCRNVCTVFDAVPWESNSPRGKYFILNQYIKGKIPMDDEVGKALYPCTTCKKCDTVCQVRSHNAHHWMSLRFEFNKNKLHNTGLEIIRSNVLNTGNFWGVPAEDRLKWLDVPTQTHGKVAYWSGCWASTIMDNMAQNATRILHHLGIPFVHYGERERCCGLYLALGGYKQDFKDLVRRNLEMFNESGIDTIVFSCPGCYATFNENYPQMALEMGIECNIRFKHIVVYLSELIADGNLKFAQSINNTITYHDSCHVGRWFGHYEEPRSVIRAIPGLEFREMEHIKEQGLCCGLVSAFDSLASVQHSGIKRVQEAEATGSEWLVTNCAGCGSQFNATCHAMGTKVQQMDLTELVARALGIQTVDPSAKVGAYMAQCVELLQDSVLAPIVVPAEASK